MSPRNAFDCKINKKKDKKRTSYPFSWSDMYVK